MQTGWGSCETADSSDRVHTMLLLWMVCWFTHGADMNLQCYQMHAAHCTSHACMQAVPACHQHTLAWVPQSLPHCARPLRSLPASPSCPAWPLFIRLMGQHQRHGHGQGHSHEGLLHEALWLHQVRWGLPLAHACAPEGLLGCSATVFTCCAQHCP